MYDGTNMVVLNPRDVQISAWAYHNGTQSVSASTFTKIELDTEKWDVGGYFDSTTNYRFTPLVEGRYLVTFRCGFESLNTGKEIIADVRKNGTTSVAWGGRYTAGTFGGSSGSGIVHMNGSTDYIELFGFQGDTVSRNVAAEAYKTFMSIVKVSD
jgi:hypothetical protein